MNLDERLLLFISKILKRPKHGKVVVCYLASSAMLRKPPAKFEILDIDPTLCTHIFYSFAGLDEESYTNKSLNQLLDIEQDNGNAGYKYLTGIKKSYPHIKVTLSLGGWNEGSEQFSEMAGNRWERFRFIRSVMQYLEKYEFDGLDIIWKYPTVGSGTPEDKDNFVTLVKELKEAFLPYGYILSASLSNIREIMSSAYDLVNLNRYLDFIYLLGNDYRGPWRRTVGASAPLKGLSKRDDRNVEYIIKYLLSFGLSPDKLVLAILFTGQTFILRESDVKNIEFGKTKAVGFYGFSGPYINGFNMYGYNEVCLDLKNNSKWVYHWDKESSTPYLRDGRRIITYDDTRSIANKVKLGIEYNIAGFMAWSIDTDDFKGLCDMPNDTYTYMDFTVRFNDITKEKFWQDSSKIPNTQTDSDGNVYGYLRNKQIFGLKQNNFRNYPLLRTINEAIYIALEEKKIVDTINLATTSLKEQKYEQNIGDYSDTHIPCEITCSKVCFYEPGY
ncbi:probable chitinase 2 isoform X2 [Nymphalis io]|uniref:probable chitinase 2 isoform X2 n=1 Tax=Inachis io TaxID=171585 RepID=UPI002169EE4C|nr:probable chitinase 2 isoform X2 [Nymphalis io]